MPYSQPLAPFAAQAKDCVRRLLVRDPRKRPDAQSILKHEWLRGGGAAAPEAPMQPEILNRMKRFAGMNRFKKEALRVRQGSRGGLSLGLGPPCVLSRIVSHHCVVPCPASGGCRTPAA